MSFLFQSSVPVKRSQETTSQIEPLAKRKRCLNRSSSSDINDTKHYGVPIYELLRAVETPDTRRDRKKLPKTCSTDVLFTDKYMPKSYVDLRGSQDVQRQILRWISRWRTVVWNLEVPESDHIDEHGRPLKKILLVHGPPGAGKTTAVKVMAKTEGFDVLEINASDDRGASAVQQKIKSALFNDQATSKKPVCIVADEVDGAESGFVRCLIELLKADSRKLKGVQKKGKKGQDQLLKRPIICICNEAFTRTLFDLRQYCDIVYFPPTSPNRLLAQLEEINRKEGLKTPTAVLTKDIQETDGDFRACLNRLQFGGDRSIASKDSSKSVADMTLSIFDRENVEVNKGIDAFGEPEKLLDSCFEQYTHAYYVDDRMIKPCEMGDWYALVDHRRFAAASDYAQAAVKAMFQKFSSLSNGHMKYSRPPKLYEDKKRTLTLTQEARHKSSVLTRAQFSHTTFRSELIPYVWRLACPEVNHVPTPEQRALLQSCCESLADAGIRLFTERLENGSMVHRLDPPIDLVCCLDAAELDLAAHGKYVHRSHLKRVQDDMRRSKTEIKVVRELNLPGNDKKAELKQNSNFFTKQAPTELSNQENKVWVSYREGFSNAVRKRVGWNDLFI